MPTTEENDRIVVIYYPYPDIQTLHGDKLTRDQEPIELSCRKLDFVKSQDNCCRLVVNDIAEIKCRGYIIFWPMRRT